MFFRERSHVKLNQNLPYLQKWGKRLQEGKINSLRYMFCPSCHLKRLRLTKDDIKLRKQVQVIYILKKQVLIKSPKSITTSTFEKQEPI